ncbi:hypothetical protein Tco_0119862, partial [Tanacetum coccineum]
VEERLLFFKKNEVVFCEKVVVLKRDVLIRDSKINELRSQLEMLKQEKESYQLKIENFENASKSLDQLLGSQIADNSRKGVGFVSYNAVPPPYTGLFAPPTIDLSSSGLEEFQQPEFEGYGLRANKSVCENSSNETKKNSDAPLIKEINCHNHQRRDIVSRNNYNTEDSKNTHPNVLKNMSPKAVLLKTGLTPLNTVRPVNTAHPKTSVHSAKSKTHFSKQAQSTAKRPFYKQTALTRRYLHDPKRHYYTRRYNAVNTARSY